MQTGTRETRTYSILVDGQLATTVISESPWRIADAWRGDGEVTVVRNLIREYLDVDGGVIRTEHHSKVVTR